MRMSIPLFDESLKLFEAASHGVLYELASTGVSELWVADYLVNPPEELLRELNRPPTLPTQIHISSMRYTYIPNEIGIHIGVRYR
jgi:hypothetical protein